MHTAHERRTAPDPAPSTDLDRRYRPSPQQMREAAALLRCLRSVNVVVVPVVCPGKTRGVWNVGQTVSHPRALFTAHDDLTYGEARDAAAAAGRHDIEMWHARTGGTYAYARIEREPRGGIVFAIFEDGYVAPTTESE